MGKRIIRDQIKAIRDEAEAHGARFIGWAYGSKHPYVALDHNGEEVRVFMAGSPSIGTKNLLDRLRRKTREALRQGTGSEGC